MTIANASHLSDEDLILHFYGESSHPLAIDAHLALCRACHSEFEAIARTLTMVVTPATPERGDLYGLEVWQRIRPQLPAPASWPAFLRVGWNMVTMGAAVAVIAIAAFAAGRYWPSNERPAPTPVRVARGLQSPRAVSPEPRGDERARTVAIIDHLERSERVLLDLTNADGANLDVSEEQAWAAELVDANRLYREAAAQAGETATALVLDALERSLLDIVHAPSTLTPAELEEVRARLDAAALLFKVRVLSGELRERETAPPAPRKTT
jgi:hypothetical protein